MKIIYLLLIIKSVICYKQFNWYYDNRIHNSGNIGLGGKLHAFTAPYTSKLIDKISYNNENVRLHSLFNCRNYITDSYEKCVLDFGCGVGISTTAINNLYPKSFIRGLDCSVSMLNNCPKYTNMKFEKEYVHKTTYPDNSVDFINCMFLFHEVPDFGRKEIFDEINRILVPGGYLNILDIRLSYEPNKFMLAGEPFLLDYLKNFNDELKSLPFEEVAKKNISNRQLDKLFVKV